MMPGQQNTPVTNLKSVARGATGRCTRVRAYIVAVLALALGACGSSTTTPETGAPSTDTVLRVEVEIASSTTTPATSSTMTRPVTIVPLLVDGQGPGTAAAFVELRAEEDGTIVRWYAGELTVAVAGNPTPTDLYTLERYIESVAGIEVTPKLEIIPGTNANIVIHFLPKDRWREVIGEALVGNDVDGQARYLHDDGDITEVTVVVNSSSSQLQRNRTIVHEMLHAYGLGHHSCPGGLLYGGSEYEPEWRLSAYDRVLLTAWYAEHPGEPQVDTDLPCPAITWDTVVFEGVTLWCRLGTGECFEVDARNGVASNARPDGWYTDGSITLYDPALYMAFSSENGRVLCTIGEQAYRPCETGALREVTRPNRWYDGAALYDYNPETHLVRIFEGQRLLCEKPAANRVPCQFTDGQVLTGVDLYTDGEFVYEKP